MTSKEKTELQRVIDNQERIFERQDMILNQISELKSTQAGQGERQNQDDQKFETILEHIKDSKDEVKEVKCDVDKLKTFKTRVIQSIVTIITFGGLFGAWESLKKYF
jgi:archaellum component FlaC